MRAVYDGLDVATYPEMPITTAGENAPSFTMHQFWFVPLSRASSRRSWWKMGKRLRRSTLTIGAIGAVLCA